MRRFMLIATVSVTACSSTSPDACTPDELSWSRDNGCFFDVPAAFFSVDSQDCGPPDTGSSNADECHHTLQFSVGLITWQDAEVIGQGPYTCTADTLTFNRGRETATWDADRGVLTWRNLDLLPTCLDD